MRRQMVKLGLLNSDILIMSKIWKYRDRLRHRDIGTEDSA